MRRHRAAAFLAFAALLCCALPGDSAVQLRIPNSPTRWVTDTAGFLSPETIRTLDEKLESYEQQTGHQIIVYIGQTTGDYPIEEFADKAFQSWAIGRKGLDDGVALFIMAEDRQVRLEVGYGLEAVVPDIIAGRIINDVLITKLRAGDADGAVSDAVAAIVRAISGEAASPGQEPEERPSRRTGKSTGEAILIAVGIVILLILFITNPSLAVWLLINIMSGSGGRSGGAGGFGGGGFRGGGGRSGGGGASGRW